MNTEMTDLSVLIPEPVVVVVRGESVEVKQLKMKQLPKVMRVVAPYFESLKAAKDAAIKSNGEDIDVLGLIMAYVDPISDTVSILVERDRAWVDDLDIDEMVRLVEVVLEVNVDFFIQKVLPSLSRLVKELGGAMKVPDSIGRIPSSS